ncbi:hypothetical protein CTEN210_13740 [Chaetoceros tenuissimus]|uniref:MYND-type domain-containing protein n=1 Tax=Chaetoceros tenuissimus TaxID=426638 RepID=A0AAD3D3W4_9STRA|nr:hypothetical protein CTEN210_13740 [Chaetoceros tenuissimus]
MPSTTNSDKPTAPCAACNKEGAVLRCVPCRDAGVDVFFCNRDCQVKLWKTHKAVCKKTSNGDLRKEQSSANKENKQEGKKGLQLPEHLEQCTNCLRKDVDIGFKLSMCSKCKSAYYCSRECQVEDWPRHKHLCKQNCEYAKSIEICLDSRDMNIWNLFQKWEPTQPISSAIYYALAIKGIEQQPPVKAVIMEIEFNYNAQTFVVAEVPRAVAIADLSRKEQLCEMYKNCITKTAWGVHQVYIQFAVVSTKELGEKFVNIAPVTFSKSVLDQKTHIDMREIRYRCAKSRMKSGLFRGWKSIRSNNLQKQMEQMNLGQYYTAFVQNALQFFCNKSLQNTHRIVVNVKMGKEIGQISQLLNYRVMPIAAFKECKEEVEKCFSHVEDTKSRPLLCTETAIKTLFVDAELCFAFDFVLYCEVNVTQNKTAKQCKKAADKYFKKLQQEVKEMPSDLLEKVSL